VDTAAMADEIRSMGGAEFVDPLDIDDTLKGMGDIVESVYDVLNGWGLSLSETGVNPRYAEAAQEAAADMAGIADKLREVTSGGVMRGPGG
jgi:hypothetical protein